MATHDGNGWVSCRCGRRHWGLHGAAGLLLVEARPCDLPRELPVVPAVAGARVLLQLRAAWTHQGGTWGLPGGARDSHEDVVTAALREAAEEVGVRSVDVTILGEHPGVDHIDWAYTYVVAVADGDLSVGVRTQESDDVRWVGLDDVAALPLHPAFGDAWPGLREVAEEYLAQPRNA